MSIDPDLPIIVKIRCCPADIQNLICVGAQRAESNLLRSCKFIEACHLVGSGPKKTPPQRGRESLKPALSSKRHPAGFPFTGCNETNEPEAGKQHGVGFWLGNGGNAETCDSLIRSIRPSTTRETRVHSCTKQV